MLKKKPKKKPETQSKPAVYLERPYRPESCASHKFIVEIGGLVDTASSNELTNDSICFNCGLYFSTWVWYSNKVTEAYRDGIDNEAGQLITFLAVRTAEAKNKIVTKWGETLLELLRTRRKENKKNG